MISVIIPAYNAEATIRNCLNSLLAQTYGDYEAIVVDDGSSDGTARIVASYAAADKRFRLLRQENAGVSSARNAGMSIARGGLIGFVDSDDTVSPAFLEALLEQYEPGVLPFSDIIRSDGNGSALRPIPPVLPLNRELLAKEYLCGALGQGVAFSVWNKLFSADVLRESSIHFSPELTVGEDMLFCFLYLRRCREVRLAERAVYRYTIAENSAMLRRRDYTDAYGAALRALRGADDGFPPIGEDVLAAWALECCVYILTNPSVTDKSYPAFSGWMAGFTRTELCRTAMQAAALPRTAISRKRRALLRAMHSGSPRFLYALLRIYSGRKNRMKGAAHDGTAGSGA